MFRQSNRATPHQKGKEPMRDSTTDRTVADLVTHLEQFQRRVIRDALLEGDADYWLRRARTFDAVGTPEADDIAQACRNRSTLEWDGWDGLLDLVLEEVCDD